MPQTDSKSSPGCWVALIAIGLLILVPSGLCTGLAISQGMDILPLALLIGGPFIVIGLGMTLIGFSRLRADQAPQQEAADETKPPC